MSKFISLLALEDSCDGPQDSSINSDDSNDTDLTSEGKSEDLPTVKPQSSFLSKGKPLSLAKRGFPSKLRGGAGEKYSVGKKTFSGSKKRGQTIPVRRGRGNGRGYRGYFNYQNVTLQVRGFNCNGSNHHLSFYLICCLISFEGNWYSNHST